MGPTYSSFWNYDFVPIACRVLHLSDFMQEGCNRPYLMNQDRKKLRRGLVQVLQLENGNHISFEPLESTAAQHPDTSISHETYLIFIATQGHGKVTCISGNGHSVSDTLRAEGQACQLEPPHCTYSHKIISLWVFTDQVIVSHSNSTCNFYVCNQQ